MIEFNFLQDNNNQDASMSFLEFLKNDISEKYKKCNFKHNKELIKGSDDNVLSYNIDDIENILEKKLFSKKELLFYNVSYVMSQYCKMSTRKHLKFYTNKQKYIFLGSTCKINKQGLRCVEQVINCYH